MCAMGGASYKGKVGAPEPIGKSHVKNLDSRLPDTPGGPVAVRMTFLSQMWDRGNSLLHAFCSQSVQGRNLNCKMSGDKTPLLVCGPLPPCVLSISSSTSWCWYCFVLISVTYYATCCRFTHSP